MIDFVKCNITVNAEDTAQQRGLPETLISDRGSILVSRSCTETRRALGMTKRPSDGWTI